MTPEEDKAINHEWWVTDVVEACLNEARRIAQADLDQNAWLTDDEIRAILKLAAENAWERVQQFD